MGIDPATSSTTGAALALRQGQSQIEFGVKALNQTAQQQQDVVTTLLGGDGGAGGNVTATRGQNLNIVV